MSNQFIFTATYEDFQHRVIQASFESPILLDLWAQWCPPCLVIAPVLDEIIQIFHGKLALAKIEVDEGENMKIAGKYRVRGFPTVILIDKGEEVSRFSGVKSKNDIEKFIKQSIQI